MNMLLSSNSNEDSSPRSRSKNKLDAIKKIDQSNASFQNEAVRAALTQKEHISFEFREKTYRFPHVVLNRFIVGAPIEYGNFGTIFDCQDSRAYENHVIKVVSDLTCRNIVSPYLIS